MAAADGTPGDQTNSNHLIPSYRKWSCCELFHHQLKAALKSHPNLTKWVDSLPMVLLGIRTTLKDDLHCNAAELVYDTTLRLPVEFFHSTKTDGVDTGTYSTAQPQVYKRVRATCERSRVTLRALAGHSRALDASHASAKGVNCTACGSEIACASASKMLV